VKEQYGTAANYRRRREARRLAGELGASPNQVALAWLLSRAFPVFPIVGPRTVAQVRDACGAGDLVLTPKQVRGLESGEG
jgi:aryl-alcohol dehydrogenase-like predicted oxidoreductase